VSLLRASPGMPSPKQLGQSVSSSSSRLTNEAGFEAEAGAAGALPLGTAVGSGELPGTAIEGVSRILEGEAALGLAVVG
jgi:hypothetical protein